uniref:Protein kinase domain-containing protein n=1 Tax=Oryza brachyantha TaxID=4533 RepID=J3L5P6_ORYBR
MEQLQTIQIGSVFYIAGYHSLVVMLEMRESWCSRTPRTATSMSRDLTIIHGDIKASNVLLDAKLCEFGFVHVEFSAAVRTPTIRASPSLQWDPVEARSRMVVFLHKKYVKLT